MSPQDEKRQKRLEQVRNLLAKANATNFPEEAATFREHADKLMTQYAIEEWQISENTPLSRPEPEMRVFDMSWWTNRNPFYQDLWWLMQETAKHCRCVCVYWEWVHGQMKVAGLPSDLDYFDLLFTQLMLEHAKRLAPTPNPSGELGQEVFKLRQAGTDWKRITQMVWEAGMVDLTPAERKQQFRIGFGADGTVNVRIAWREMRTNVRQSIKNRLANANRRYVRENNLQGERNYVHPKVYQRSFSEGFVAEVTRRMRNLRSESEADRSGDNHMALALRDIRAVVVQWTDMNFPKPEPEEGDDKKKSKAVSRELAFDMSAYSAGSRAGREVNINANPSKGISDNRKELPR